VVGKIRSLAFDERGGKLEVEGHSKTIWVDETFRRKFSGSRAGDSVVLEANEGRFYDFLKSVEWGEAVSQPPSARVSEGAAVTPKPPPKLYTPAKEKHLPPTSGKGRACSARFMAKFQELVTKGLSVEDLVDQLCLQESEIYQLKQALEVKHEIEEKVHTCGLKIDTDFDTIRPSHYTRIARVSDPEKQVELARKVAEENLSVRELEREIEGPKPPPPPLEDALDQGIVICCKTCPASFHLLHLPNGKHKLEEIQEMNKK
jgi:hypothetical protein